MFAALCVLAVAVFIGWWLFFRKPNKGIVRLPGRLRNSADTSLHDRQFSLPKPKQDNEEERRRDCRRIFQAQKDVWFAVKKKDSGRYGDMKMLELSRAEKTEKGSDNLVSFESCMEAVERNVGSQARFSVEKGKAYVLLSASTPFEFAMSHGIMPMFGSPLYVVLYDEVRDFCLGMWESLVSPKRMWESLVSPKRSENCRHYRLNLVVSFFVCTLRNLEVHVSSCLGSAEK